MRPAADEFGGEFKHTVPLLVLFVFVKAETDERKLAFKAYNLR